jgi:hypothetical protein
VERADERRRRAGRQPLREQRRGVVEVERRQHQLVEAPATAQLVAQPAQQVVAGEPVGAVGAEHQHRQLLERRREAGQQLERRLVGPLQVVEHHERGAWGADRGERAADGLEERRPVAGLGRPAQLRQQ